MATHHTDLSTRDSEQQVEHRPPASIKELLESLERHWPVSSSAHQEAGQRFLKVYINAVGNSSSASEVFFRHAIRELAFRQSPRDRDMEIIPLLWKDFELANESSVASLKDYSVIPSFITARPADSEDVANVQSENERLRSRVEQLQSQVEMLKSRVAQERQSAAKAVRMHDQLLAHHDATEKSLLDALTQRDGANSTIQAALIGKAEGRLCMTEHYHGEVVDVSDNRITAVFHIGGELIEQTYESKQFLDGQLPSKGDELEACVYIAKSLPRQHEAGSSHGTGESRTPRRNVIPLPRTF